MKQQLRHSGCREAVVLNDVPAEVWKIIFSTPMFPLDKVGVKAVQDQKFLVLSGVREIGPIESVVAVELLNSRFNTFTLNNKLLLFDRSGRF